MGSGNTALNRHCSGCTTDSLAPTFLCRWVSASCDSGPQRSALLFKLHRLKFVQLLQSNQMMRVCEGVAAAGRC